MAFGYTGKYLRINLTEKEYKIENPGEEFYRNFLGGRNVIGYYLNKEVDPKVEPLSPENKIIIATSVLTGTPIAGSSRFSVGAKSPLTLGFAESEAGGWWGPEIKKAGYDGMIIEGKSDKPCYILIKDREIEFKDASEIRGKQTLEAEEFIKEKAGDSKLRVLQCGPAGENLVRIAALCHDLRHWNGRTGMGAVFGSKNLRAIAVRGTGKVEMKDREKVLEYAKWFGKNLPSHPGLQANMTLGTSKNATPLNEMGLMPTKNFKMGSFEDTEGMSGETMHEIMEVKRESCFACPVRCKRAVTLDDKNMKIKPLYGGPEWETMGSLGSNCMVGDAKIIAKANELCGAWGLDTIGCGVTIAFAMECFEHKLITLEDTGGIDLTWGNGESMLKMIDMIATREGIGDLLAEGSYRAGEKIGKGAVQYSMTAKMQELAAHEPRGKWGVGLGYAISPSGGDHLIAAHDSWFETEGKPDERLWFIDISDMNVFGIRKPIPGPDLGNEKVRLFTHLEYMWSLYNVLDVCIFVGVPEYRMMTIEQLLDQVKNVTGWDISFWEAMKIAEKGINLARMFNTKAGKTKDDDMIPERFFQPLENGAYKGVAIDKEVFLNARETYYEMRGWNKEGEVSYGKAVELGIEELL